MEKENKEKAIKKELGRLTKLFKNIPENKKTLIDGLVKQSAWMFVTLQELQEDLNDAGLVEDFKNGKQQFVRENSLNKTYISLQKNYLATFKELMSYLPDEDKEDELEAFLKK